MNLKLHLFILSFFIWSLIILGRLVQIQIVHYPKYAKLAAQLTTFTWQENPRRGRILDRNQRVLAISVRRPSLCVYPPLVKEPEKVARFLSTLLHKPYDEVYQRISQDKQFVWIQRFCSDEVLKKLRDTKLHGIGVRWEYQRFYPQNHFMGPILGAVDRDGQGIAGLERFYNDRLAGHPGKRLGVKMGRQGGLDMGEVIQEPQPGKDLITTLDLSIQAICEKAVEDIWRTYSPQWVTATVMELATYEIRAHAVRPGLNPNLYNHTPYAFWHHYLCEDYLEPGSIFKPFVAYWALKNSVVTPGEIIDCGHGKVVVDGVTIRDHTIFDELTFEKCLIHSSNAGLIHIGQRLSPEMFLEGIHQFGFDTPSGIDLPNDHPGLLRKNEAQRKLTRAYWSIGQGLGVTQAQMLRAYGFLLTGRWGTPHFGPKPPDAKGKASLPVNLTIVDALRKVVEMGTGSRGKTWGVACGGKTGTAEIALAGKRGYAEDLYLASFIGWVGNPPRHLITIYCMGPQGKHYGGEVAAPYFNKIAWSLANLEVLFEAI